MQTSIVSTTNAADQSANLSPPRLDSRPMPPRVLVSRLLLLTAVFLSACAPAETPQSASRSAAERPQVALGIPLERLLALSKESPLVRSLRFREVAAEWGLDFTYLNGSRGNLLMSEATGGGCGWIDFDRDDLWDLYLAQGGTADADSGAVQPQDRLYRNEGGGFRDVTEPCGLRELHYGQGVAVGDFDDDGFEDVFVSNVGPSSLWRNCGDGTFVEIMGWGGDQRSLWSSSAAWADLDRDGDLDLYVCNYVDFDPRDPVICRNASGERVQCQPNQVEPVLDEVYLNLGNGMFEESSERLGLIGEGNRALGVAVADFLGDARPEIYVANDATANFVFVQDDQGRWTDLAPRLGCALDANGRAQASMGVAVGDFDHNQQLDLYLTHFEGEWNTLYANFGPMGFRDATSEFGAVQATLPWVGFGTVMQDFDQNGWDDLFVANGHIDDLGRKRVLAMPPQLLTFDGTRWTETGAPAGGYFQRALVGRGCAEADVDNDGDFDLAVMHQNTPCELLRNDSQRGHWLALEFVGRRSNRRGIGTRVTLTCGPKVWMQELIGGGSYASSRQPRLIFGLGDSAEPCALEVRWPSGEVERLTGLAVNRKYVLTEPSSS